MPTSPNVLAIDPLPTTAAVVALTTLNTFASGGQLPSGKYYHLRTAWIPTNTPNTNKWRVSFATLQTSTSQSNVMSIATRQAFDATHISGFVVDVMLRRDLLPGEVVSLVVAQTGATDYFDPEPIED